MKRVANKDLNRDNWDEEDAPEERGTFEVAENEIISKRKVLTVKRKQSSNQSSVFKSFGGFSTENNPQTFSGFFNTAEIINKSVNDNREKHLNNLKHLNRSFLENIQKYILENEFCVLLPLFEDYQRHILTIKAKYPLTSEELSTKTVFNNDNASSSTNFLKNTSESQKFRSSENQFGKFPVTFSAFGGGKAEESGKTEFLSGNMTNNQSKDNLKPFGNFPLFGGDKIKENFAGQSSTSFFEGSIFNQLKDESKPSDDKIKENAVIFGGDKSISTIFGTDKSKAGSIFGVNESKPFNLFSSDDKNNVSIFGGDRTSFQIKSQESIITNDNDEEYVPPKAESRDIKESDSVFDIRCKLFYLNEKDWKERGVGNLFIKPLSEGKCQLVLRADNTLGTILLNILVTKDIPLTVNKNNLSLVTMTDFAGGESKSTSLLIRVKTSANADELLSAIKNQVE